MTRLCRERMKRKKELDAKLTQLRDLSVKEFQQDSGSGEPEQSVADKTNAWVTIASSVLALFTSIGAMFKKDESSSESSSEF